MEDSGLTLTCTGEKLSIPDPPQAQETCHTSFGCLQSKIDLMFTPSFTYGLHILSFVHTHTKKLQCVDSSYPISHPAALDSGELHSLDTLQNAITSHRIHVLEQISFILDHTWCCREFTPDSGLRSHTLEGPCIMLGMEVGLGAYKNMSYLYDPRFLLNGQHCSL